MFNRFIAIIIFILLIPIFLIISLSIFLEDGTPIFFLQKRVGVLNTTFYIFKFRTMKRETPNVATHLLTNPKVYLLKTGEFLRKSSLDELPNLLNIIRGDMVFVGPRPALFNQDDLIALRNSLGVNILKPGITGWAQVNGRDDIEINQKVGFDFEYLQKKSLLFDFKIICLTVQAVFLSKNIKH